ncbi:MAG: UbiA family prenyltransferase [Bacteroidota bacterium]
MKKSTILHLRFPFSFFLLPVFFLACAIVESQNNAHLILSFFILHFLVYPASNGYNSYFDKDENSIGGLKNPPKVTKELYFVSLIMDAIAIFLSLTISFEFMIMVLIYGLVSKAYSHPSIRLKKFPVIGLLAAGFFQGYFTYLLSIIAIQDIRLSETFTHRIQMPGILSSVLLLGSYPMTQVYQHEEDARRGDLTISRLMGILGTFHFTAIAFTFANIGFAYYFVEYIGFQSVIGYFLCLSPILVYFGRWYLKVRKDRNEANYTYTMRLNLISSLLLNGFFLYLWLS